MDYVKTMQLGELTLALLLVTALVRSLELIEEHKLRSRGSAA